MGMLASLVAAGASEGSDVALEPLGRPQTLDGRLVEYGKALLLVPKNRKPEPEFQARVATSGESLVLGCEIKDDNLIPGDLLTVSLFFSVDEPSNRGFTYRFAMDGKRSPESDSAIPNFAQSLVRSAVSVQGKGMNLEVAIPLRSFPRFPASKPLLLELCLTYEDKDDVAAQAVSVSNCVAGQPDRRLRLPETFRRAARTKAPPDVRSLEARLNGWAGYSKGRYPAWVTSTKSLKESSLVTLVGEGGMTADEAKVPFPKGLAAPDRRPLVGIFTGSDPFTDEGPCMKDRELWMGLYAVKGKSADRVLEWPASNCSLGQAVLFELDNEGTLSVGYSSGSTLHFAWSRDHFERTEIGRR